MTVYFDKLIDNYLPTDSGWAFHPDNIVELPTVESDYKLVIDTTNPLPNAYSQLMFSTTSSTGNAYTYYLNLITSTNGELPQIVKDADASNAKSIKIGANTKLIFKTNYPYNKDRLKKIVCRCRKEAGTTASLRVGVISVKDEAYITPTGSIGTNDFYDVTINSTTTVSETYNTYIGYVLGTTTNAYTPSVPDVDFPIALYDGTTDIALVIEVTGGIGNYYIDSIELQDTENSIADLPNGRFVVSSLEGLTEDNKLSPVEKTYIKTMLTEIDAEYAGALADGMAAGVSSALLSALATKWDALHAIVDPLLENMGTVSDITSAFDDAFAEYFTAVSTLEEQIAIHTAGLIEGLDERSRWEVQISGGPTVPLDSTPITLSAILLKDGADVTNDYAESDFGWHRVSSNTSADLAWRGGVFPTGKTLAITKADLESGRATFLCKFKYLYGESLYYFKTGAVAISEEVPGPQGERGIQGPAGVDGQPSYFHLKYSDDGGVTFTDYLGETPGKYFGTYVDSTKSDSEDPSDYTWVLVKGDDGERGIQGPVGENGLSSYLHIKYSDDGGMTFTANNGEAVGDFLGQYVDNTEADSTDPSDYIWKKIKGEQGTKGDQGPQGNQGVQGPSGTDGLPSYFHVRYSDYSDGTDMNDVGGAYIGTYVDTNPNDSDYKEDYTWILIKGSQGAKGEQGIPGVNGANGETSYLHIKYSNDGGTTFTANNGETVGEYLGQYVDFTEADSATPSHYKWVKIKGEKGEQGPQGLQGLQGSQGDQGIQGPKGADGLSSYTHIAYATGVDGENFNVKHFPSATYIGMYVDNDPDDSTSYTSYNWSLIKGADGANGIPGPKGDDGLTAYFHTAWANNSTGTSGFSTTVSDGKLYIGTYTDHTQEDSDDETKYKWVKMKGDTGSQGPKGDTGSSGADGRGIASITYTYATSQTQTGTKSAYSESMFTLSATNKYGWQKEVISYTDGSTPKTTEAIIAVYGDKGADGSNGSDGNGIASIAYTYATSQSFTGTKSAYSSSMFTLSATNKFGWQKEVITFTNGTEKITEANIAVYGDTGAKGATGDQGPRGFEGTSVTGVTEYYLATTASSGVTSSTAGWTTTLQPLTATKKYLWNYEKIHFSEGDDQPTIPVIIGVYGDKGDTGDTGRAITSIQEKYLVSPNATGITRAGNTWHDTPPATTTTNKYLWNYEIINWSTGTTPTYVEPFVIGVHGATGAKGEQGIQGPAGTPGFLGLYAEGETLHLKGYGADGVLDQSVGYIYAGGERIAVPATSLTLTGEGTGYILFNNTWIDKVVFAKMTPQPDTVDWVAYNNPLADAYSTTNTYVIGKFQKDNTGIHDEVIISPVGCKDYTTAHFMEIIATEDWASFQTWAEALNVTQTFERLAAYEAFIGKLFARNVTAGSGNGSTGGFRFRAQTDSIGDGTNVPVFDVMYDDKQLFKVNPTNGKIYFGELFWYDPADGAIHTLGDNTLIRANGTLKALFAELLGTVRTGAGAATNARVAIQDESGIISGPTFTGTGLNDMSIIDEGNVAGNFEVKITGAGNGNLLSITLSVLSKFTSPKSYTSGLTFANGNLISCDFSNSGSKIYIHSGVSSTILSSFISPGPQPRGLAFDGTNLISCDFTNNRIYKHSGVSKTILSSFASPSSGVTGLTFANGNLISCDYSTDRIYIHNGVSSTILSSFALPNTSLFGLAFDGTNLISADLKNSKIHVHSGVSSTILASFVAPWSQPSGLAFDGENLISCDYTVNSISVHKLTYIHADKFTWSIGAYTSGQISMTTAGTYALDNGTDYEITITFAKAYGHTLGDKWNFIQGAMRGLSIRDSSGSEYVAAGEGTLQVRDKIELGTPSLSANGYSLLPNGLIAIWGTHAGNDTTWTLPISITSLLTYVASTIGGGTAGAVNSSWVSNTVVNGRITKVRTRTTYSTAGSNGLGSESSHYLIIGKY